MIELSSESVDMLHKFVARLTPEERTWLLGKAGARGKNAIMNYYDTLESADPAKANERDVAAAAIHTHAMANLAMYIGYAVLEAALVEAEG